MNFYTELKDDEFIINAQVNETYMYNIGNDLFKLSPSKINLLSNDNYTELKRKIINNSRSGYIYYEDISNIIKSKYKSDIIKEILKMEFIVINVPKCKEDIFKNYKLKLEFKNDEIELKRTPPENRCISDLDIEYIKSKKHSTSELASYTNYDYLSLPYLEMFENFNNETIAENLINIIHESMYAKIHYINGIPRWHNYLGYIPCFLNKINYTTDWDKLFEIFKDFLRNSYIYFN